MLVLESLDHALARGARIHAGLTGFVESTDAAGMVTPHHDGIGRALRMALEEAGEVPDDINTQAPSTPLGDAEELRALSDVFGAYVPPFSSTKSMTVDPLGACGAHEAIYTLLRMRDGSSRGNHRSRDVSVVRLRRQLRLPDVQKSLTATRRRSYGRESINNQE